MEQLYEVIQIPLRRNGVVHAIGSRVRMPEEEAQEGLNCQYPCLRGPLEEPAEKIPSTEEGGESEGLPLDPPPTNSEPGETEPVAVPEEVTQVNVNMATQAELEALPHIGKTAAQRLVAGRHYADLEQVRKVLSSLKKEQWQQVSELIAI